MNNRIKELTTIALFPALMGATAGISIPLFNLPPITLQTFFVFMAGLTLGPRKGALSMIIYVLLGAIGLPIFSGFRGGLNVLVGLSGGFLIGFIFSAAFIGYMKTVKIINNEVVGFSLILVIGTLIIYMFGAAYIAFITSSNLWLILANFVPYLVGDAIKIVAASYVYARIRNHITYEYA